MLVRLLGKEQTAADEFAAGTLTQPFTDAAGWAESSIAWLYTNGLTRGSSQQTFGGGRTCTAKDYAVFLLRALGYRDGTDFTYDTAEAFAAETGIYSDSLFGGTFTRGDLALMPSPAKMSWILPTAIISCPAFTMASSIVSRGGSREKSWRRVVR